MVLYKRKPLVLPPPGPLPANINVKVWHINETGEWFLRYTEYLQRMDFYMRRQFTCEITGSSFLTFFEALNSEEAEFRLVEEKFPLKLREPVAKFMHFNEIGRVDLLVERTHSRFRSDFYPGERVFLRRKNDRAADEPATHGHKPYIIKEKASFNAVLDVTGSKIVKPAFSKYMITEEFGINSLMVDQNDIYRDRTTFTKHLIKCFCKITLRRVSTKSGAPLCVKDEYLAMYGLTMDWPASMLKFKEDIPEPRSSRPSSQRTQNGTKTSKHPQHPSDTKRNIDDTTNGHDNKKQKTGLEKEPSPLPALSEPEETPKLYSGPNPAIGNAYFYNDSLDYIPVRHPGKQFAHMYKLLEVFQFCQTFSKVLLLSPFSLDNFIKSLQATDIKTAGTLVVKSRINSPLFDESCKQHTPNKDGKTVSDSVVANAEKRKPGICRFIENRGTSFVTFEPSEADNQVSIATDDVDSCGASLILECFVALERLFISENGDWKCMVMDKWYDEDELVEKPIKEDEGKSDSQDDAENTKAPIKNEDDVLNDPEIDDLLERCLNFRKVSWTERLSKRQFKNGYWIIILLGIFQDCMHIPMYTAFAQKFIRAIVPPEGSATHLNKILWENFCKNLSLEDKVFALWILVDIASNFSQEIRTYVEDTLDVCTQIRSEKLKLSRRLKSEMQHVSQLSAPTNDSVEPQEEINQHQATIDKINQDRSYLTQKLIENDVRRLRALGSDRNGNKYYWQELSGVQRLPADDLHEIGSGRLWIRGISVRDSERILSVSQEQLIAWKKLAKEKSVSEANAEIFKIRRTDEGSIIDESAGESSTIVFADGKVNVPAIESSALYRKMVDETPEQALLSESQWIAIELPGDVDELILWSAEYGNSDQALSKQLRAIKEPLFEGQRRREGRLFTAVESTEIARLEEALDENFISDNEIEQCQVSEQEKQSVDDDNALEKIATEIMMLDDGSQTESSLKKIKELEERRDHILNTRTYKDHSDRQQSKAVRQATVKAVQEKVGYQAAALTSYLNAVIQNAKPAEKLWTNELARSLWNTSLYLGASGKPIARNKLSVKERMTEIFDGMTSSHQKKS
ncbi:LAFA_0G21044g1_1 [Lachancea sp. 'fantastica']|nr:LAFA_0G21044g1_1 [Lachancea sp. 'fantastica']